MSCQDIHGFRIRGTCFSHTQAGLKLREKWLIKA
jgi:hypothetical protein